MRALLFGLFIVVVLSIAGFVIIFYRRTLAVWFGLHSKRDAKADQSQAQDGLAPLQTEIGRQANEKSGEVAAGPLGAMKQGGGREFRQSGSFVSENSHRSGMDRDGLAPMIVVASDDGNRGAVLPYENVSAAAGNWAPARRIGSGGSATVYRADIPRYGTVAVKRFLPENGSGRDWTREVEALCQCRHPHILEIIGYADDGPENLIVMPLMQGGTLCEALNKMWWASRVSVLGQMIRALSFLHGKGMVHRDVKSSNILLDISLRRARLADFGLAKDQVKRPGVQTCHGTTGMVVGSPGYMAPELMMRPANEKTDAYAAGVIFLEILTGLPAWDADENGAILTERAVKDGSFVKSLLDQAGSWPSEEVAACSEQGVQLTLFDPSRRRTIAVVEQDASYLQHLERANKADEERFGAGNLQRSEQV